jgi:uncharacterized protein (DUF983 family)
MTQAQQIHVALSHVALKGRCPRCGNGSLFDGFIKIAEKCKACDLSFAGHDTGDGPAFFIILPLCLIVAGSALWVDLTFAPPMWVHMVIWPIFIMGVTALAMRPIKSIMVALQYRHRDVETYDDSAQQ